MGRSGVTRLVESIVSDRFRGLMGAGSSDENGPRAGTWAIRRAAADAGTVAIDIDGRKVWMSSDDAALEHVPEAWVTAFCIPASQWGTGFVLDEPVDASWRAGAAANVAVTAAWWGGDPVLHLDAPEPPGVRVPSRGGVWVHREVSHRRDS